MIDDDAIRLATRVRAIELLLLTMTERSQLVPCLVALRKETEKKLDRTSDTLRRQSLQRLVDQFDEYLKDLP